MRRPLFAIALLAAVTLLAGACGDDLTFPGKNEPTPEPSQTATQTTTPTTPTPTPTPGPI